jgi:hypothetical protein
VLAPVLALSACGSAADDVPPAGRANPSVSVPTTAPSTTTTAPKPYSFDPAPTPPPLVNTGTDYVAIAKSLLEYTNWLLAHRPDVSLIEEIAPRGSSAYQALAKNLPILRRTHRRLVEEVSRSDEIEVVSVGTDSVSVRDTQYLTRQIIVDELGAIVSERQKDTTTYVALLVRNGDRWYLASAEEQSAHETQL